MASASSLSLLNPILTHHHKLKTTLATSNLIVPQNPTGSSTKPDPIRPNLSSVWREIQGSGNWEHLVDPLNPLLRSEIIRYGEFVSACYKSFDFDPKSKRYLNCKYGKKSMLSSTGMASSGYEVTKYIYATPDIAVPMQPGACRARWIGYVAVSTDERENFGIGRKDIVVAFRGTVTNTEWIANMMSSLTAARFDPNDPKPDVRVESGFLSLYTSSDSTCRFRQGSCREQLLSEVSRIINNYKTEELSITLAGHSMGSSLALLLGYDIAELGLNRNGAVPVTVYSFGGPRVGNPGFKRRCEELGVKVLRVVNVNDPVTKLPGFLLNEKVARVLGGGSWYGSYCYVHVGVELELDFFTMENPACVHDLDTYIELIKSCPYNKTSRAKDPKGVGVVSKVGELMSRGKKTNTVDMMHAARQVGGLVQSLGF